MLNGSFQKCVKLHTNLFWQLLMETLSLPMSNGELKIFVEYHSIQMLNTSFQKCVKFHTNLFWQLLMETLSLLVSINELKIFV